MKQYTSFLLFHAHYPLVTSSYRFKETQTEYSSPLPGQHRHPSEMSYHTFQRNSPSSSLNVISYQRISLRMIFHIHLTFENVSSSSIASNEVQGSSTWIDVVAACFYWRGVGDYAAVVIAVIW